jgi:hypothetical protein
MGGVDASDGVSDRQSTKSGFLACWRSCGVIRLRR